MPLDMASHPASSEGTFSTLPLLLSDRESPRMRLMPSFTPRPSSETLIVRSMFPLDLCYLVCTWMSMVRCTTFVRLTLDPVTVRLPSCLLTAFLSESAELPMLPQECLHQCKRGHLPRESKIILLVDEIHPLFCSCSLPSNPPANLLNNHGLASFFPPCRAHVGSFLVRVFRINVL